MRSNLAMTMTMTMTHTKTNTNHFKDATQTTFSKSGEFGYSNTINDIPMCPITKHEDPTYVIFSNGAFKDIKGAMFTIKIFHKQISSYISQP